MKYDMDVFSSDHTMSVLPWSDSSDSDEGYVDLHLTATNHHPASKKRCPKDDECGSTESYATTPDLATLLVENHQCYPECTVRFSTLALSSLEGVEKYVLDTNVPYSAAELRLPEIQQRVWRRLTRDLRKDVSERLPRTTELVNVDAGSRFRYSPRLNVINNDLAFVRCECARSKFWMLVGVRTRPRQIPKAPRAPLQTLEFLKTTLSERMHAAFDVGVSCCVRRRRRPEQRRAPPQKIPAPTVILSSCEKSERMFAFMHTNATLDASV
jgi:hypothetical protein